MTAQDTTIMKTTRHDATVVKPKRTALGRRGAVLGYLPIAVIVLAYVLPLLYLINTALKSTENFNRDPNGLTTSLEFGNFATAWEAGNFGAFFLNSVVYTLAAATLGTLASLLVAFPVSRGYVRHPRLWYALFVVILFLPNSLITQFQLVLRIGLYDTPLGYILILAAGIGIGPLLIAGYLKSVPTEFDEAVALDGGGYWRFLFLFLPPLIKPALTTVFILQAINVWNDIILATILLPSREWSPITLGLFAFQGTYSNDWPLLACATMIVAAPLMLAYVLLQRFFIGGALDGAIKG